LGNLFFNQIWHFGDGRPEPTGATRKYLEDLELTMRGRTNDPEFVGWKKEQGRR
jgi:hypothetical protein